jgi:hypothetical protein
MSFVERKREFETRSLKNGALSFLLRLRWLQGSQNSLIEYLNSIVSKQMVFFPTPGCEMFSNIGLARKFVDGPIPVIQIKK